MPRKRARDEAGIDSSLLVSQEPVDDGLLRRLRNMWEFASLMQYIYFFGRVVKIDEEIDIEELEKACIDPTSSAVLSQIGLALLKYVSSHRGLTPELFDEFTRRQYLAKAPARNPFGDEEEPKRFDDLDIFTRIRVLQQLSTWTFGNAERIRSQMPEKDTEHVTWRIEPFGWDSDDRTYFLLDDDRLYRRTDAPLPPPPQKARPKAKPKRTKSTRSSKRRKLSTPLPDSDIEDPVEDEESMIEVKEEDKEEEDGFGGMKWECIAITFEDYQEFLDSIRRSRDPNEKALHKAIVDTVLPILEKRAEAQRQKMLKKQRELETLSKLATAKRSSRLADKIERQKEIEEIAAAEEKRRVELAMAHKEQERQKNMEEARESRMLTREQRLKEREVKRILHEEELAKLEEMQNNENQDSRISERNLKTEMERRQKELELLAEEEDRWIFDCSVCGVHGENIDDGTHSIACERCNIWQHSKCHGIKVANAERDDFHFICTDCKRKEEDAKKPKIRPLKLGRVASNSPQMDRSDSRPASSDMNNGFSATSNGQVIEGVSMFRATGATASPLPRQHPDLMNGPALSPQGQSPGPPGYRPFGPSSVGIPQPAWQGNTLPPPQRSLGSPGPSLSTTAPPEINGHHGPPPLDLHKQAHASAVASSSLPHNPPGQHTNGHVNGSMAPPSPQRYPRPLSSHGGPFDAKYQPAFHAANGVHSSPTKSQAPLSPSQSIPHFGAGSPRAQPQFSPLSHSPNASFPPPHQYQQQRAGISPVKQPSPSPQYHAQAPRYHHSPISVPPVATPTAQALKSSTSPMSNIRATPHMASSPIPPLGSGPVIPMKHDTPRPTSRDSIGETPVFPPSLALSPTATENGTGMGVEAGQGGLGVGTVPVKKMPAQVQNLQDDSTKGI